MSFALYFFSFTQTLLQANSGAFAVSSVVRDMSSIQADTNGTKVLIGPVFTVQTAESLADVALRFSTSTSALLKFNSDVFELAGVQVGQQICVLPCKK
jgi:hypothetical protein